VKGSSRDRLSAKRIHFTAEGAEKKDKTRECLVLEKKFWPFKVLDEAEQTDQHRQEISFLQSAFDAGHKSFIHEFGFGASTDTGREGYIVRRSSGGRYWQIDLDEGDDTAGQVYVEGFQPAATAVLSWLRGEERLTVLADIKDAIVKRPGERGR
jgi:hypothetical protein